MEKTALPVLEQEAERLACKDTILTAALGYAAMQATNKYWAQR